MMMMLFDDDALLPSTIILLTKQAVINNYSTNYSFVILGQTPLAPVLDATEIEVSSSYEKHDNEWKCRLFTYVIHSSYLCFYCRFSQLLWRPPILLQYYDQAAEIHSPTLKSSANNII